MALSITELELQSTEYLPAREVMSAVHGIHGDGNGDFTAVGPRGNTYYGGILNGANVQGVLSDINVHNLQVSLIANVLVEDLSDAVDIASANNPPIG